MNSRYEEAVLECAKSLNIKNRIPVFVTDVAAGPAIGGLWEPYLLIPPLLGESLSDEELRLVILHELGHWRRRDTAANFLIQCAFILHWFNPAAWLFASMSRSDCELACDEFVMGRMVTAGPRVYGTTILKVLATVRRRNTSPVVLGILGKKQQIKQRFNMIAKFRTASVTRIIAGWSLIGVIVIVAATGKLKATNVSSEQPEKAVAKNQANTPEMKRYENAEWKFALDIPKTWNAFPGVSTNSPYEVIRFASQEDGTYDLLIIFRNPHDPKQKITDESAEIQQILAKGGFGNFGTGKMTIGSNEVATLDFDQPVQTPGAPAGSTWSCRHYIMADNTLSWVLGFGTSGKRAEKTDLYDRMVKSFKILK
jgi:hypothetical protein